MCHGNNQNLVFFDQINQCVGEIIDTETSCLGLNPFANSRMLGQQLFRDNNFRIEVTCRANAAYAILLSRHQ